jgi:hypothetical protein
VADGPEFAHSLNWNPHNCLLYVLAMRWKYGGKITYKRSDYGWWVHFKLLLHGWECEYTPIKPVVGHWFPPPIYRGFVKVTKV